MSKKAIWELKNGTEPHGMGWEMRLVNKSHWNIAHEWQTGIGDTIPNSHELYFPFTLGHNHSYIKRDYTIKSRSYWDYTVKSHLDHFLENKLNVVISSCRHLWMKFEVHL